MEIWQADDHGAYIHSRSPIANRDVNFQGYGKFETASSGEYLFRTIKPVPYPGRPAPHIHFKVKKGGRELLTTQCYVKGDPGNERDRIWQDIGDGRRKDSVTIPFVALSNSTIGELAAAFDIVLGTTPSCEKTTVSGIDRSSAGRNASADSQRS